MKRSHGILLGLAGAISFAVGICSLHLVPIFAQDEATTYCADLDFGKSDYSGSKAISSYVDVINGTSSANRYKDYSHNIRLSSISSDHVYFEPANASTDYAVRIGSGSSKGTVTFYLEETLCFEYVEFYAWSYGSDETVSLKVTTDKDSVGATLSFSSSLPSFEAGQGVRATNMAINEGISSFTLANTDSRVSLGKILFKVSDGGTPPSPSSSSSSSSSSISSSGFSSSTSSGDTPSHSYWDGFDWNQTGSALKTALYNHINSHTNVGYDGLWDVYKDSETDENGKIVDMYSNKRWTVGQKCGNYKKEGDCVNREHTVPQSVFNEASPMKADAFHVFPTDGYVNGRRSRHPHGEVGGATYTSGNGSMLGSSNYPGYSGTVFEPIDQWKGDFARAYFYMVTCYQNKVFSWNYDMFSQNTYPSLTSWAVNMLLEWSDNDPVDDFERQRNEGVYKHQKNRNPFIDYPEAAHLIWDGAY